MNVSLIDSLKRTSVLDEEFALVEVLERKGILTEDEWEKQIRKNIEKNVGKTKYRDIQFSK